MDKIYSRPRIKIFYSSKKKVKKKLTLTLVIIITIFTVINTIKSIDPIFEEICKDSASKIATKILNEESTNVLKKYDYKDIVLLEATKENKVLKTNVQVINEIASDIALQVNKRLEDVSNEKIKIPIGAISGNKYLSGIGPEVTINIIPSGRVTTDVKTEFINKGINQTVYRIYLEVVCNEKILTSYNSINTQIINQVLLVETVIIGDVPETYYNLDGLNNDNQIDLIE